MIFQKSVLTGQIFYDIVKRYFFTMLCFVSLIAIAIATIIITQSSRQLITQHELLLVEKDKLESEWQNLLLEENVLTEHTAIERKARAELNMTHPTFIDEIIVKQSDL